MRWQSYSDLDVNSPRNISLFSKISWIRCRSLLRSHANVKILQLCTYIRCCIHCQSSDHCFPYLRVKYSLGFLWHFVDNPNFPILQDFHWLCSPQPDARLRYETTVHLVASLVPSYTAWWQRHMVVNNLPKVVIWHRGGRSLNLQPLSHWYDVLATRPSSYGDFYLIFLNLSGK